MNQLYTCGIRNIRNTLESFGSRSVLNLRNCLPTPDLGFLLKLSVLGGNVEIDQSHPARQ